MTRARIKTVACPPVEPRGKRSPGRPRLYGDKIHLRGPTGQSSLVHKTPGPIVGEGHATIRCGCSDLLWRPMGRLVRFVIVAHPRRGTIILMSSDTYMAVGIPSAAFHSENIRRCFSREPEVAASEYTE